MSIQSQTQCPRCGVSRLLGWEELNEEQREVVRRLSASADYSSNERQTTHRWCTNCWYEETESSPFEA